MCFYFEGNAAPVPVCSACFHEVVLRIMCQKISPPAPVGVHEVSCTITAGRRGGEVWPVGRQETPVKVLDDRHSRCGGPASAGGGGGFHGMRPARGRAFCGFPRRRVVRTRWE